MPNTDSNLMLNAIDGIYAWVGSGARQDTIVAAAGSLLGSRKGVLLQLSLVGHEHTVIAETGLGADTVDKLLGSVDDCANFVAHYRGWDQGNVYDAARLQPIDESGLSGFYRSIVLPNELNYAIAGVIARERTSCIVVCYYRGPNDYAFTDDDLGALAGLLPHWRRAIAIKNSLNRIDRQSQATRRILDHAPFSILLVDAAAYVMYQNYMAKVGIRNDDGLSVHEGRLRFRSPETRKDFMALLQATDQAREAAASGSPIMMAIERPSGAKPYQLMILPVQSAAEAGLATGPTYGIFIYDPTVNLPVDANSLCALEGLTQAEANLCESLYRTKNLSETANQLEVSVSTAKTHLLNTFRKLEINSQSELMKYLAHMPKISRDTWH
jgi:DNA-binding CsgD family transcriptional regulator